jgi:hypothetical protein
MAEYRGLSICLSCGGPAYSALCAECDQPTPDPRDTELARLRAELEAARKSIAEVDMILGVTGADDAFRGGTLRAIRARMTTLEKELEAARAMVPTSEELRHLRLVRIMADRLLKPYPEKRALTVFEAWLSRVESAVSNG